MDEIKAKLDVRGVFCPMNFVKIKAALANLKPGERLEVILDEGESLLNVPQSLKREGHQVVEVENLGEAFKMIVCKGKNP